MPIAGKKAAPRAILVALIVLLGTVAADWSEARDGQRAKQARKLPAGFFGINAQWVHILTLQGEHAAVRRHAAAMQRFGIESARVSPQWNEVEPAPPSGGRHDFDFSRFDRTVAALAKADVRASIYLVGAPGWARVVRTLSCDGRHPPPDTPSQFAAYAGAVVHRYGRGGSFWRDHPDLPYLPAREFEVWNEPNWWDFWCPAIDPRDYADLFVLAARRIHAADPLARVVLGGLVGTNRTTYWPDGSMHGMETGRFLYELLRYRSDARAEIDAVGLHTYGDYPWIHRDVLRYVRHRMAEVGLGGVPILYNEFGWSTSGDRGFVTREGRRAAYIRELVSFAARSDCGVISVAPYAWATREDVAHETEDWFGIVRLRSARPYRTARVYSRVLRLFRGELDKPAPARINACR
jgi:hypothetical protein